jgi:hypothetical protein
MPGQKKNKLVTNCDWLSSLKHLSINPHAFTEYGVLMLFNVLKIKQSYWVQEAFARFSFSAFLHHLWGIE